MIVRLDNATALRYFDSIKDALNESLGLNVDVQLEQRLWAAISERRLEIWAVSVMGEVRGFVATTINVDFISGEKVLHVYSIAFIKAIPLDEWKNGIEQLKVYAKRNRCSSVTGNIGNEEVVKVIERIGGSVVRNIVEWRI